jgi:hypothetical protein
MMNKLRPEIFCKAATTYADKKRVDEATIMSDGFSDVMKERLRNRVRSLTPFTQVKIQGEKSNVIQQYNESKRKTRRAR